MALVDFEVNPEVWDALATYTTEEMTLRISVWPDESLTVDNGDHVLIEFWRQEE